MNLRDVVMMETGRGGRHEVGRQVKLPYLREGVAMHNRRRDRRVDKKGVAWKEVPVLASFRGLQHQGACNCRSSPTSTTLK